MRIIDCLRISFLNLFRQKLRTLLTIFSIVIGATLISLVYSIIPGFRKFLDLQLNTLSSPRLIEVYATETRPGEEILGSLAEGPQEFSEEEETDTGGFFANSFKDDDIEKMKKIKGVREVYEFPITTGVRYVQLENEEKKLKTNMVFYYPEFLLETLDMVAGKRIADDEKGKVVLAYEYVEAFGYENPEDIIGKKIIFNVNQIPQEEEISTDQEQMVNIDITQQQQQLKTRDFELEVAGVTEKTILSTIIFISLEDSIEIEKFARDTDEVLTDNDRRRFVAIIELEDQEKDEKVKEHLTDMGFSAQTFEDSKNVLNDIFGVLTIVFSSFGIIAMAVSSLGIMNTLVMAVYERTREIGIMKAVGATRLNIAVLFTIEAAMIGFIGGLVGLGLGYGMSEVLNIWGHKTVLATFETLDLSNVTTLLFIGPALSTFVSTIAGIYPAMRASQLDPVEALRYE